MQRYVDWFLVIESLVRFCLLCLIISSFFRLSFVRHCLYKCKKVPLTTSNSYSDIEMQKKLCFSIIAVRTQNHIVANEMAFFGIKKTVTP